MWSNASEIYSAVYLGLGQPEDQFLSKVELSTIFFRRLSLRLEGVRQSEQGKSIVKTSEFTLANTSNTEVLTDLETDFVIPMWCERQVINITSGQPVWEFVPTVALAQLAARRSEGYPSCAFYGATPLEVIVQFSYYGNEIATPSRVHRVWYAPTVTMPDLETEDIVIPENLRQVIVLDCLVASVPLMITNATKLVTVQPQLASVIESWKFLLSSHIQERAEFEKWFEQYRKESQGSHRARRRRDVLRRTSEGGQWLFGVRGGS